MHNEVVSIYNFDRTEFIKEFKESFNEMIHNDVSDVYTMYFSSYDDYKVTTEVIYFTIYDNVAIIFASKSALQLTVDDQLLVLDGDIVLPARLSIDTLTETEPSELVYLGDICNYNGYVYEVYTINRVDTNYKANFMYANELLSCSSLKNDESELMDISLDFLNERIEKYKEQVDKSIELEEPAVGLDENPYSNDYYDNENEVKIRKTAPNTEPRQLGSGKRNENI